MRKSLTLFLSLCAMLCMAASANAAGTILDSGAAWTTNFGQGYTLNTAALGDINGDGKADAIASISNGNFYAAPSTGSSFGAYSALATGLGGPRDSVADVNGDGKVDLVSASSNVNTWTVALQTSTGFAAPVTSTPVPGGIGAEYFRIGDLNGDHRADILFRGGGNRWLYSYSQGSTFAPAVQLANSLTGSLGEFLVPFVYGAYGMLGDVNGDGKADAVQTKNGIWEVALSTSVAPSASFGPFSTWISNHGAASGNNFLLSDVNNDGRADAIAQLNGTWSVALSTGTSFAAPTPWNRGFAPPASPLPTPLVGDATGDGSVEPVTVADGTWRVGAPPVPEQIAAPNSGWTSALNENFDGTALDSNRWSTAHYDYWYNGQPTKGQGVTTPYSSLEAGTYTAANSTVAGGLLSQKIGVTGSGANTAYTIGSINSLGRISSNGQYVPGTGFRFKEGYVEARVNVPKSVDCGGCWPAFWLLPAPATDPATGVNEVWGHQCSSKPEETDIFEFFPHLHDDLQYYDTHWGTCTPNGYGDITTASNLDTAPAQPRHVVSTPLTGGFHTYGMLRTATKLQFFVDGIAGPNVTVGVPKKDMYLILTLQRGKDNTPPTNMTFPTTTNGVTMQTDYIKVWK